MVEVESASDPVDDTNNGWILDDDGRDDLSVHRGGDGQTPSICILLFLP